MKKITLFAAAAAAVFISAGAVTAAATELPEYDARVLTQAELDEFFADKNPNYDDYEPVYNALKEVYATHKYDVDNNVFGMNFTAVETDEVARDKVYYKYFADYVLTASADTSVVLIGNYEGFDTIALGVYPLKAGEEFRVIEDTVNPFGKITYQYLVQTVKSFDCVAVPVTQELIDAYENIDPTGNLFDGITPTPYDTTLTLTLNLYETGLGADNKLQETGGSWQIGGAHPFTYKGPDPLLIVHNLDKEGDYYKVEVYAGIDSLDYTEVGFKIDASCGDASQNETTVTTTVYKNMSVDQKTDAGETRYYVADDVGGKYMFGAELLFNAGTWTNEGTTINITPYAKKADGTVTNLRYIPLTVTDGIIKAGYAGSQLFGN